MENPQASSHPDLDRYHCPPDLVSVQLHWRNETHSSSFTRDRRSASSCVNGQSSSSFRLQDRSIHSRSSFLL
jgi:hypothetical protein